MLIKYVPINTLGFQSFFRFLHANEFLLFANLNHIIFEENSLFEKTIINMLLRECISVKDLFFLLLPNRHPFLPNLNPVGVALVY